MKLTSCLYFVGYFVRSSWMNFGGSHLHTTEWPLRSHAQQTYLWLATMLSAAKARCKLKPLMLYTYTNMGAFESSHLSVGQYCGKTGIVTFLKCIVLTWYQNTNTFYNTSCLKLKIPKMYLYYKYKWKIHCNWNLTAYYSIYNNQLVTLVTLR